MAEFLRTAGVVLGLAFKIDRAAAVLAATVTGLNALMFATLPLWLKQLTDSALAGDRRGVLVASLLLAASVTLTVFGGWIGTHIKQRLQEITKQQLDKRLAWATLAPSTLTHLEDSTYVDKLALVRAERDVLGQSLEACLEGAHALILYAITLTLLASIHPLLLLLPVFGLGPLLTTRWVEERRQRAGEAALAQQRTALHLFTLATGAAAGKELRLFGLGPTLLMRHRQLWESIRRTQTQADVWGTWVRGAGWLTFTLGYSGVVIFTVWLATKNQASVGDVLMALTLAAELHRSLAASEYLFSWIWRCLEAVSRLLWLERQTPAVAEDRCKLPPQRLTRGLRLDTVSFRYPGTIQDVLKNVSLELPAGTTVALVGENGSGKTTLVKLLCGLFVPTSGSIKVDSIDLGELQADAWQQRLSATFQDFVRFELRLRESVGIGDVARVGEPGKVEQALARAGAADLPASLPQGLETQLGPSWPMGVDLSGGQWQKVALGRSLMRDMPLLLILDEPSASLDAHAEQLLFERYAAAAQRAASRVGTITLLVSHRFSTVAIADQIVVLEGGRIREVGNHSTLLAAGGLYAELYALQAQGYA